MTTSQTPIPASGVQPHELARHIAEMYRDVANAAVEDLHFHTGRVLAEAVGSFAGVGYHLDLARLIAGEHVLDLGSGSGTDVFAAAVQVGPGGSVIGVDITPEQLAKAERLRRDDHVAFIAGAGQRDQYLQDIAAAGLQLRAIQRNPAYRFASERARRTSDKYGAHTIELLAVKPEKELSR